MATDKEPGTPEQRSVSPSANPRVDAGETAEQTVQHLLQLPGERRLELLRSLAVRVLPRLEGVEPQGFIERLRTAPRASAKLDWRGDAERAETPDEVFEDVLNQPIGEQRRILELAAPRVLSDLDETRKESYLRDLRTAVELALQGEDPSRTDTRH